MCRQQARQNPCRALASRALWLEMSVLRSRCIQPCVHSDLSGSICHMCTAGFKADRIAELHHHGLVLHHCLQRGSSRPLMLWWVNQLCRRACFRKLYTSCKCGLVHFSDTCFRSLQGSLQDCVEMIAVVSINWSRNIFASCGASC